MTEFIDPQGDLMVPLRCQLCGDQIGLRSPSWTDEELEERVVARCYQCAATEEAERILQSAGDKTQSVPRSFNPLAWWRRRG